MAYDKEKINKIIEDIKRYFVDLGKIKVGTFEDLEEPSKFYSVSMLVFSLVNRVIDLGDEIVSAENLGMPEKYKDIFYLLSREKIIDKETEKTFSQLVDLRNNIAHEYHTLTEKEIFEAFKKVRIINSLIEIVKKRIK